MINSRLIASGCSCTDYCWSTWAPILGYHFKDYVNVGQGGADNATIARNVLKTARPGDTVVVLWSGFDRWAEYCDDVVPIPKDSENHWKFCGTLMFNKNFLVNHYNAVERFQVTMDYIQLIDLHSKYLGYTVYNFSAFPFFKGEIEENVRPEIPQIFSNYNISNNYLLDVSLYDYMVNNNQTVCIRHEYSSSMDTHPLPTTHWEYLNKIISPKLNVSIDQNLFSKIVDETEKIIKYGKLTLPTNFK